MPSSTSSSSGSDSAVAKEKNEGKSAQKEPDVGDKEKDIEPAHRSSDDSDDSDRASSPEKSPVAEGKEHSEGEDERNKDQSASPQPTSPEHEPTVEGRMVSQEKEASNSSPPTPTRDEGRKSADREEEQSDKDRRHKRRDTSRDRARRRSRSRSRDRQRGDRRRERSPDDRHRRREEEEDRRDKRRSRRSEDDADRWRAKRSKRDSEDEREKRKETEKQENKMEKKAAPTKVQELLTMRTGGAYIPPAKLRAMQEAIADKTSEEYQRLAWERLKKRILGHVNKVNVGNLVSVVTNLIHENIIRGKGLLARSIIQAQAFSPTFSHVYAALVAVLNSKFPHVGELVLRRLIVQFKRAFKRNDKQTSVTVSKFLAHLINQQVAHELLALEILTLMLESQTDDSVEIAIGFLKECGARLTEVTPRGIGAIFDNLRAILHDGKIDIRVQYMIEVVMAVRKDKFAAFEPVVSELDLIEEDDQIMHTITLDDAQDPENMLNIFKFDPEYAKNEEIYEEIKREILGDDDGDESEGEDDDDDDEEGAAEEQEAQKTTTIIDQTEANVVAFRRAVYLTIQSSLDYQEAAHKLLKMEIKTEQQDELCHMIVDCCCQQRTYEKFYGLLAETFCRLRKEFQLKFEQIFRDTYSTIHRFELTKLRNIGRLMAHLLFSDALSWEVLSVIRLNEDDTTSASRIYIKTLFQELVEFFGLAKVYERTHDTTLQVAFDGLFPRDNPRDTRFSINFFTSIGLGGLTVDLREHLQSGAKQQKSAALINIPAADGGKDAVKAEADGSSSSSDSSSSSSSSSSSEDEEEKKRRKKKKLQKRKAAANVKRESDDENARANPARDRDQPLQSQADAFRVHQQTATSRRRMRPPSSPTDHRQRQAPPPPQPRRNETDLRERRRRRSRSPEVVAERRAASPAPVRVKQEPTDTGYDTQQSQKQPTRKRHSERDNDRRDSGSPRPKQRSKEDRTDSRRRRDDNEQKQSSRRRSRSASVEKQRRRKRNSDDGKSDTEERSRKQKKRSRNDDGDDEDRQRHRQRTDTDRDRRRRRSTS